ncbi:hypothetical protein [Allocoleopsis franciscana]|uniref:hypothetical protein n=1 Tax=Allocoleopsis franciscana TaxID=2886352 RepID=UPI0002EF639F|nr:hypothetical protein [Allocoleopsis franciscana]
MQEVQNPAVQPFNRFKGAAANRARSPLAFNRESLIAHGTVFCNAIVFALQPLPR